MRWLAIFFAVMVVLPSIIFWPEWHGFLISGILYLFIGFLFNLITHFELCVWKMFLLWLPAMIVDKADWMSK